MFDILDMSLVEKKETIKSGRPELYPFSKLEVGQGFKIPSDKKLSSMRVLASVRGRELGRKFSVSVSGFVERVA